MKTRVIYSKVLKRNILVVDMPTPVSGVVMRYGVNGLPTRTMTCSGDLVNAIRAFAKWLKSQGVVCAYHFGTFNDRKTRKGTSPSDHAGANAWDLNKVFFKDGHSSTVSKHWGTPFWIAAKAKAKELFAHVVTPDEDKKLHKDHMHLGRPR